MTKGLVFDIKRYAIHDGPGIRTTVFFKGCPLSCRWCHNPEGLFPTVRILYSKELCIGCGECADGCPERALGRTPDGIVQDLSLCRACGVCAEICPAEARRAAGRPESAERVAELVAKDMVFFEESGGGVTFSGGEPLFQPEFLVAVLDACGRRGIHRAVDTSGHATPEVLSRVAKRADLFLYDVKHMDAAEHRRRTGVSNETILKNLETLARLGKDIEARIPLIPGFNDDEENLERTAVFLRSLPRVPPVAILPFHASAVCKYRKFGAQYRAWDIQVPGERKIREAAAILERHDLDVRTGG